MNKNPEHPEETERVTDGTQESLDNPVLQQAGPPWKKIVMVVGGVVVTAAAAAIVTLTLTHNSAVHENAQAYVKGLVDGYAIGFGDGVELVANTLLRSDPVDW